MDDNKENVKAFAFFQSYGKVFRKLPREYWADLLDAMLTLMFDGKEPEFDNKLLEPTFEAIRPNLENSLQKARNGRRKGKQAEANGSEKKQKEANGSNSGFCPPIPNSMNRDREKEKKKDLNLGCEEGEGEESAPPARSTQQQREEITPPTLEEVKTYFSGKGFKSDPEKFFDYYAGKYWHDKYNNPVKDWRKAADTWESWEDKKPEPATGSRKELSPNVSQATYNKIHNFPEHDYLKESGCATPEEFERKLLAKQRGGAPTT